MKAILLSLILCAALAPSISAASTNDTAHSNCANFPDSSLKKWEEREFAGRSKYELVDSADGKILRGSTDGKASVLYRKKTISLTDTPIVEWCWKIKNTYNAADETSKSGDDFPARLYIVVQTGLLPWETVALNYVWASTSPLDSDWNSPYTTKSRMIAVQSGEQYVGQWVSQKRNIRQDFKRYFNKDIKKINGYAVMVDGDNANQSGVAYFGSIAFNSEN